MNNTGHQPIKIRSAFILFFWTLFVVVQFYYLKINGIESFNAFLLVINLVVFLVFAYVETATLFYLLIFLLPWSKVTPKYEIGIVTFGVYSGGVILLSIVCATKIALQKIKYHPNRVDILIAAFNIICLTFFFTSDNVIESGRVYYTTVVLPTLTYFTIRSLVKRPQDYNRLKFYFLVSMLIVSIVGIGQFALSGFSRGNTAGFIGYIGIVISIFLLLNYRKRILVLPIGILILALVVGMSRLLLLSLLSSPLLFLLLKNKMHRAVFFTVFLLSLAGTIAISGMSSGKNQEALRKELRSEFGSMKLGEIDSSMERLTSVSYFKYCLFGRGVMWKNDFDIFLGKPILGNGMGSTAQEWVASSHNLHVQLLAYTGILGYLIFHWVMVASLRPVRRLSINSVYGKDAMAYTAAGIIIYANGVTNGLFHGWFNMYLFMAIALLCFLRGRSDARK